MNFNAFFWIVFLTILPGLELRLSIPAGVLATTINLPFGFTVTGFGMSPFEVFLVAVLTNILLGPIIFFVLNHFVKFFIQVNVLKKFYDFSVKRTQRKVFPLVKKFGIIGIALFIAIPLPGSGSYTGALAAHLLGMNSKNFAVANLIGVIIAGIIVTITTLSVAGFL